MERADVISMSDKKSMNSKKSKTAKENKIKLGPIPYLYPIPIVLVGAKVDNKPNFEEVGDVAIMGINPALVCISSGQDHHTNKGIIEFQSFSINIPNTKMLIETDYCGVVSGKQVDKSQLFDVFYGELENAPMIHQCPVNLECKVIREFLIKHRQIFIAEIVQTFVSDKYVFEENERKKVADLTQLDPIIYALDNRYYSVGKQIGTGYKEAKKLRKKNY
jgi:flavin reductase (DIM6/NTAB) family NADH-FMN oxidoreductase RutF